ncbi:MAG: RNA methyltransferase [Bacteroidaceae bacterium]|nr:RNA methyltransferase [Bacteroidaceae bacterium]
METIITSTQNPRIKRLLALQEKSSERRKSGLFVVEGRRELEHCLAAGYEVECVYTLGDSPLANLPTCIVSPHVYERIAYRGSTEGIVAVVRARNNTLEELESLTSGRSEGTSPLFIVLESVEKPGNLGAVLRSADAAAATAVIVCDPLTDLYNPNLIRASIGACFTVPTVACTSEECITFLKTNGILILTAQLQDSELYYDTDMTGPTAIIMGTESTGLTTQWREAADAHIRIPMLGRLDSLNVSVSAAILLFEAVRQRSV